MVVAYIVVLTCRGTSILIITFFNRPFRLKKHIYSLNWLINGVNILPRIIMRRKPACSYRNHATAVRRGLLCLERPRYCVRRGGVTPFGRGRVTAVRRGRITVLGEAALLFGGEAALLQLGEAALLSLGEVRRGRVTAVSRARRPTASCRRQITQVNANWYPYVHTHVRTYGHTQFDLIC